MGIDSPIDITGHLEAWRNGDQAAFGRLADEVHAELRRLARLQMRNERPGHTLEPTALVNEAYMRLAGRDDVPWRDRGHFFAVCAQVMRHILVDHARAKRRDKRGGGAERVPLEASALLTPARAEELVRLDAALGDLEAIDAQKARIVELRYFGGLSVEETAEMLGISTATVGREWRRARAWLYRALAEGDDDASGPLATD